MAKNEKTTIWILGIAVALLLLIQFSNVYEGNSPFAVAGGGAGSSISQTVTSINIQMCDQPPYETECWYTYTANVRPPIGETWLITSYKCKGAQYPGVELVSVSTGMVTNLPDYVWPSSTNPGEDAGLRLFIDNDFYLRCWGENDEPETKITIIGVRA